MEGQQQLMFLDDTLSPQSVEIPGFALRLDYINAEEEHELLDQLEAGPWQHDWRRRIQVYGLGYSNQRGGTPTWLRDFPDWLLPLAKRVAEDADFDRLPENCVINEYVPPQGIGPHKDYADFGPAVACVSLGSHIVMDFANAETRQRVPVLIPARSLWVIRDDARWKWTHAIAPRLSDTIAGQKTRRSRRVSITFRTAAKKAT
jgi:alkylated DNA repair dioxygenase AlkB